MNTITGRRYQNIFCIFLLALVFLYRHNTNLVYPQVFYLFALLLSLNLSAGAALRRWPSQPWVATLIIVGNCAVLTSILSYSGGPESNFWVLYLLPIFTVCLLMSGAHLTLVVVGIICFNGAFYVLSAEAGLTGWMVFNIALRSSVFIFSAAVVWEIAQKDRRSNEKMSVQRTQIEEMEHRISEQEVSLHASERMADIGQFASGIAHDLKNPITVMLGTANMLLEDATAKDLYKMDLERIKRAAELCLTIMSNALNLTRSKAMPTAVLNIHDVLDSALEIYEPMLQQRSIKIIKEYTAGLPGIQGNNEQLERVFLNLMSNARGVMPSGGILRIKTCKQPLPNGAVWVDVVVEDSGPGFPSDILAKIFKPFNTTKGPAEGTGLGLYLSRQIVMDHNGRMTVENRPEGGARFILSFPDAETLARQADNSSSEKAA